MGPVPGPWPLTPDPSYYVRMRDFRQIEWDGQLVDDCRQLIRLAVREDLDREHDWTTVVLVPSGAVGRAHVVARRAGVACGLKAAALVLAETDPHVTLSEHVGDGTTVAAGQRLATLAGPARSLLTVERLVLNFIGRLSGVATLAAQYVAAVVGSKARIYDTRKTTPGWRRLEKYAVRAGGGHNHRTGLFDAVLIKDNHLAVGKKLGQAPRENVPGRESSVANSEPVPFFPNSSAAGAASGEASFTPAEAVRRVRAFQANLPAGDPHRQMLVEVEVESLDQLAEVLPAGPDVVLLDNMSCDQLREAVALRNARAPQIELEASGGVNLSTLAAIAATGVERISSGALTHSAVWLDVALDWETSG